MSILYRTLVFLIRLLPVSRFWKFTKFHKCLDIDTDLEAMDQFLTHIVKNPNGTVSFRFSPKSVLITAEITDVFSYTGQLNYATMEKMEYYIRKDRRIGYYKYHSTKVNAAAIEASFSNSFPTFQALVNFRKSVYTPGKLINSIPHPEDYIDFSGQLQINKLIADIKPNFSKGTEVKVSDDEWFSDTPL